MKRILSVLAGLTLLVSWGPLSAALNANARSHELQMASQNQQEQTQTFTGKIAKSGEEFVLQDPTSNSTYRLDDQARAKKFAGKAVKVTGTLDAQTNTIHVSNIEAA